jgi:MerR family transcriptional regulator, redox-sensitive transcriptional activator SoxR
MGLTLEEISAELAKLPENRVPERADWANISGSWTRRIDERIAELERLRAGLTQCIGCGCLSLQSCQLANPGDRVSRQGSGARYWIGDRQRAKQALRQTRIRKQGPECQARRWLLDSYFEGEAPHGVHI